MKRLVLAALTAPLLLAAAPPAPPPWPEFDAKVAEAKASMVNAPEAALTAARAAMATAQSRPASREQRLAAATSGWLEGEALIRLNRPAEAAPLIDAALAQARAVAPGAKIEGDLLKARGSLSAALGRVQPALSDLQRAFRVFEKNDAARSEAIVLQDIGSLYSDAHDYAHMIRYYEQSGEVYHDDPALALVALNNLAVANLGLNKPRDAERQFNQALKIARRLKSATFTVRVLTGLAQAQTRLKEIKAAEASLREAFRLADTDPSAQSWKRPDIWGADAQLEMQRGHWVAARTALEQTFSGQDLAHTDPHYREFHETAWRVYSALGEPDLALAHLAAFKRLDDQARDLAASTNAALIGARFDFANQDLRIARLRAGQLQRDVALAQARARDQATLTIVLVGAGAVIAGLALFGFFSMRRSRDAVRSANQRLETTNSALERALKAKSQFLATTSHEIRTPLNGILGMTQVILAERSLAAPMRERIQLVHGAGETMRALVDDILDVAKIETGRITVEKAPVGLPRLVEETARLWRSEAESKGLTLVVKTEDLPEVVEEDDKRLRQVLFNLMSNAIKFTDAGVVTLSVAAEAKSLRFSVADSGIGVAEEDLGRIFEPFTQVEGGTARRHGGTGLGLAICRDVARALGGDVEVASRLGEGSTFTLRLPLILLADSGAGVGAEPLQAPRPASLAEARILVIEPNPLARATLRAVLQPEVLHVEGVADLAEADRPLSAGGWHHLLVADNALAAEPTQAVEALRHLQVAAAGATLGVLVTSASPEFWASLARAGVAQVLQRPIASEQLRGSMRDLFSAGREVSRPETSDPLALTG